MALVITKSKHMRLDRTCPYCHMGGVTERGPLHLVAEQDMGPYLFQLYRCEQCDNHLLVTPRQGRTDATGGIQNG